MAFGLGLMRNLRGLPSSINAIRESGVTGGAIKFACLSAVRARRPITVNMRSIPVALRPCTTDLTVAKECFSGEFEEAIRAAAPLQHGFIVDAGGYIGTAAIIFARAFPDAKIITLEPSIENFSVLRKNVAAYENIVPVNKALGARVGKIALVNRGTGHWGFSIVQRPADASDAKQVHKVEVTTIPAIMAEHGVSGIDLLKLDIEGAELDVLTPRPEWIDAVIVISAELHDRIAPGCEAAFAAATEGRQNIVGSGEKITSIR